MECCGKGKKKASRVAEPGRPRRSFGRNWMRSVAGGVDRASLRTGAASGRRAEERLVVAVELLRALVAHGVGRGMDVSVAPQQKLLRFIQAKTLLILQGRERGEGLEVPATRRSCISPTSASAGTLTSRLPKRTTSKWPGRSKPGSRKRTSTATRSNRKKNLPAERAVRRGAKSLFEPLPRGFAAALFFSYLSRFMTSCTRMSAPLKTPSALAALPAVRMR